MVNQRMWGGAGRAPGTFLEQRYTHTGAPALVPFELIQTLQSYNEVSSDLVLLVERRTASEETALSPRTNYRRNETFSKEDSTPMEF